MLLSIHIDFYREETQIQSIIYDLNSEIKDSEEIKVDHYEETSENLIEQKIKQKIELDKESNPAKCKHQIDIFSIELNWFEYY